MIVSWTVTVVLLAVVMRLQRESVDATGQRRDRIVEGAAVVIGDDGDAIDPKFGVRIGRTVSWRSAVETNGQGGPRTSGVVTVIVPRASADTGT